MNFYIYIYIGDNDQWKSMIDIVVYAITTQNYVVIYRWVFETNISDPTIKYGLAEFKFGGDIVKHFLPKNKSSKILYESKK